MANDKSLDIRFSGRQKERQLLLDALDSKESEMISVVGRRRVGKTMLVQHTYGKHLVFKLTGIKDHNISDQLKNFSLELQNRVGSQYLLEMPNSWLEAFTQLATYLKSLPKRKKWVLFFDEVPWIATHRSRFLEALGHFWNTHAYERKIVIVLCGSAASWMIKRIIHHKGSLHNRITSRFTLAPFTLGETEDYFKKRAIKLDRYQIVQLYMVTGGVPYYLRYVKSGLSAAQNIDNICFGKDAPLRDEFEILYSSLFDNADQHIQVIRALANSWVGLTRKDIISKTGLKDGGSTTRTLNELKLSGFIDQYLPFGKIKRTSLYRLSDAWSLFCLKFLDKSTNREKGNWMKISQSQKWKIWSGYAFENVCLKHISKIKETLSISGIHSTHSSYFRKGTNIEDGIQIDLVIDRADHIINLCEMKFYSGPYTITKAEATHLRKRQELFRFYTKTKKQLSLILVTSFGLNANEYSIGLIDHSLTIDDLF